MLRLSFGPSHKSHRQKSNTGKTKRLNDAFRQYGAGALIISGIRVSSGVETIKIWGDRMGIDSL
jgi:hypothetical protein